VVIVGVVLLGEHLRFVARAEHAEGMVVEVVRDADGYYDPVVGFPLENGLLVLVEVGESVGDPSYYRVGQPVEVLYDPGDPSDGRLDTWVNRWGHGVFLVALGLWIIGMGVLGWRQSRPQAQPRSLRRQVPAHLLSQDEKLLAATLAVSGPPFVLLWVPLALGASMMLAAGLVGDWLGVAGIVTVGLGGPLALVVCWRPVGVVLTDRRLIVSRTTRFGRFRKVLLDAPRSQAAVQEARAGIVLWGALEFVVCVDAATGHAPIRLTFWRPPAQQQGRTIDAALSHPQAGGG
jgi:hypothetical protein